MLTSVRHEAPWLFPGQLADEHRSYRRLVRVLHQLGIPARASRLAAWRELVRDAPPAVRPLLKLVMRALFQDPFTADEPVLYLACSRAMEGRTHVYLHKATPKDPDARAMDPARGGALWEASAALLGRVVARR